VYKGNILANHDNHGRESGRRSAGADGVGGIPARAVRKLPLHSGSLRGGMNTPGCLDAAGPPEEAGCTCVTLQMRVMQLRLLPGPQDKAFRNSEILRRFY
jgi:hypothetical protein